MRHFSIFKTLLAVLQTTDFLTFKSSLSYEEGATQAFIPQFRRLWKLLFVYVFTANVNFEYSIDNFSANLGVT